MRGRGRRLFTGVFAAAVVAFSLAGCVSTLSREQLATEYYNIGSAYFELGELDKSASFLGRAIELSPELARASYNLARVYVLQARYADALELLDLLLAEDPGNTIVLETIAYAYYESGDLAAAAEWYDRALEESPTDPDLLGNRALVAAENGDYEGSVRILRRLLELDAAPEVYLRLADAERELGNPDEAVAAYAQYLELASQPEPEALFRYADVLEAQEYYADAIAVLGRITESAQADPPTRARAHFHRGRLLLAEAEETASGLDAIREAVSQGFDDAGAAEALLEAPGLASLAELEEILRGGGLLGGDSPEGDAAASGEESRPPEPEGDATVD